MSESQDRRAFLKRSAAAVSAAAVGCRPAGGRADAEEDGERTGPSEDRTVRGLPPATLRAVAAIVLPSELGEDGVGRVATGFEAWLAGYAPVAEQVHGYGSQEIRYGPPDPAPRWRAQLEALDREARARHDAPFDELEAGARRALIEAALSDGRETTLPDRPGALRAEHVAVGLAGYFFGSPEATDLCYGRRIGGGACRPLSTSSEAPPALATAPASPESERVAAAGRRSRPDPASAPERGLEPGS